MKENEKKKRFVIRKKRIIFNALFLAAPLALHFKDDL